MVRLAVPGSFQTALKSSPGLSPPLYRPMTTERPDPSAIASFRSACRSAHYPLILAGAGLSAASGIPTFRGANGLWRQHDPLSLATPEAFQSNPSKVWQFYHYRREVCLKAEPNQAHRVLSWLGSEEGQKEVWPKMEQGWGRLITQNVDGLSRRSDAAYQEETGSPVKEGPIEMHGSLFRTRCLSCHNTEENFTSPICESLAPTTDLSQPLGDIPLSSLPRCNTCSEKELLRPAVVWFGESIPLLPTIFSLVDKCDLLLVLGTSSTVYPAAGFADQVRDNGGRVAVFNLEREQVGRRDWMFEGGVEEQLPLALGRGGRT